MPIKSLKELQALRRKMKPSLHLRNEGEDSTVIDVLVMMGTDGISAGARETMQEILKEVKIQKIKHVKVVASAPITSRANHPVVAVRFPGEYLIQYEHIIASDVHDFVRDVIVNRTTFHPSSKTSKKAGE